MHTSMCNLEHMLKLDPPWLLTTCMTFSLPVQVFGQVYIPVVNYVLMGLTMIVVGIFQTSARLGNAYGTSIFLNVHSLPGLVILCSNIHRFLLMDAGGSLNKLAPITGMCKHPRIHDKLQNVWNIQLLSYPDACSLHDIQRYHASTRAVLPLNQHSVGATTVPSIQPLRLAQLIVQVWQWYGTCF